MSRNNENMVLNFHLKSAAGQEEIRYRMRKTADLSARGIGGRHTPICSTRISRHVHAAAQRGRGKRPSLRELRT